MIVFACQVYPKAFRSATPLHSQHHAPPRWTKNEQVPNGLAVSLHLQYLAFQKPNKNPQKALSRPTTNPQKALSIEKLKILKKPFSRKTKHKTSPKVRKTSYLRLQHPQASRPFEAHTPSEQVWSPTWLSRRWFL